MAVAVAHPNIALVKYWGKRPGRGNVPATPSLSITLDGLTTRTRVEAAAEDSLEINGERREDAKVAALVAALREDFALPGIRIASCGNFPVGAGLASSASGFAALVTAVNETFSLGLGAPARATWARRGSASAARSLFGGFVALDPDAGASAVLDRDEWPLEVVIAVTSDAAKAVSSTEGMERSRNTSPFYGAWMQSTATDFDAACRAVRRRDFEALAATAEHSCLKLHALMLSTRPGLLYWNAATIDAIRAVQALRSAGTPVFFTIDAGPQVKAVCLPAAAPTVAGRLVELTGVKRVMRVGLGAGARLIED